MEQYQHLWVRNMQSEDATLERNRHEQGIGVLFQTYMY